MKRRFAWSLGLVALALAAPAGATTLTGGTVINQTWTPAGNPYIIQGDLEVPAGSYLKIMPGTQVTVQAGDLQATGMSTTLVEIVVHGSIEVLGSAAQPVVIASDTDNTTSWWGMRIASDATLATFNHFAFRHAQYGLRSEIPGNLLTIENGVFRRNHYQGLDIKNGIGSLDRAEFLQNSSYAIRIYGTGTTATLTNLLMHQNGSGGLRVDDATVNLANATVYDSGTYGIYGDGANVTLTNVIAVDNGYGVRRASGIMSISHSNVWGNQYADLYGSPQQGAGMISANPQFANAPSDLRLSSSSLCIDAGTNVGAPMHDFDNVIRPLDGNGIGGAQHDMGAYEYVSMPFCGDAQLDAGENCDDGAANGSYGFCNASCTGPGPYCGDGTVNGPESCDDGNLVPGDGCDATCMTESGSTSSSSASSGAGGATSGAGGASSGAGAGSGVGGSSSGAGAMGAGGGAMGACVPGEQVACACPGGAQGVQACNEQGNGFGSCQCGGLGADDGDTADSGGCAVASPGDAGGQTHWLWLLGLGLAAAMRRPRRANR